VAALEDVLDVYARPYDEKCPVVCMDETSQQLLSHPRAPLPAEPGQPQRVDSEYERHGVWNVFMAAEPLRGRRRVQATERRTKRDWARFIRQLLEEDYREAEKVVLVMDNLNTHTVGALYETFSSEEAHRLRDRLEIHHTPKHGSWLNIAEIELSILSRQCLGQRISNPERLCRELAAWETQRNTGVRRIEWHFTTQNARIRLKRLYPVIHD
jgi:hypothetical protein